MARFKTGESLGWRVEFTGSVWVWEAWFREERSSGEAWTRVAAVTAASEALAVYRALG